MPITQTLFRELLGGATCLAGGVLISASAAAETLLIGNKNENTVSFVDIASGAEQARVATGIAPHEIAISPDGLQAAVVAYGGTSVDILDIRRKRVARRLEIAPIAGPHGIIWLRSGALIIAADRSNALVLVDPRTGAVRSTPTDQKGSHMVAVSPDQRRAYVANIISGTVGVFELPSLRKLEDIRVGGMPEGLAVSSDGAHLWIGSNSVPQVRIVELKSCRIVATLPTDPIPIRVAISPDGKTAVTSNFTSGTLSTFDAIAMRPSRTIKVSGEESALQVTLHFSGDSRRIFVAETGRNTVAEVDLGSGQVVRRLQAGRGGDGLAIAP
jgi:DNA-binding beta-propeller fold protein YncE